MLKFPKINVNSLDKGIMNALSKKSTSKKSLNFGNLFKDRKSKNRTTPSEAPKLYLYHGTQKGSVPNIMKEGLVPYTKNQKYPRQVSLTGSMATAVLHAEAGPEHSKAGFAHSVFHGKGNEPAILKVDVTKDMFEKGSSIYTPGDAQRFKNNVDQPYISRAYEFTSHNPISPKHIQEIDFNKAKLKAQKKAFKPEDVGETYTPPSRLTVRSDIRDEELEERNQSAGLGFNNLFKDTQSKNSWFKEAAKQRRMRNLKLARKNIIPLSNEEFEETLSSIGMQDYHDELKKEQLEKEQKRKEYFKKKYQENKGVNKDNQSKDKVFYLKDGKKVVVKSKTSINKKLLNKVYSKIPDDKNIPVVFQTKKQYLVEYIKNQEKKHNVDFPIKQEKAYLNRELDDMGPIVSRYTTKDNKYIEPRTVYFTDTKFSPKQFKMSAAHEVGHEIWERNPKARKQWKHVNKNTSPTAYGRTDRQEDFCESYMLYKAGKLTDPKRLKIIKDVMSKNKRGPLQEEAGDRALHFSKTKDITDIYNLIPPENNKIHFTAKHIKTGKVVDFNYNSEKEAKHRNRGYKDWRAVEIDTTSKDMTNIFNLLPPDKTKTVERKSFRTVRYHNVEPTGNPEATNFRGMFKPTDKPVIKTYSKSLYPSGHFKDLFKEGDHVEIKNRHGDVVRDLTKEGDNVKIAIPGSPNDDINLSTSDEILYEPWMMDAGSYVFQTQNAPPGLKGKLLKIGTEGDDVSPVQDKNIDPTTDEPYTEQDMYGRINIDDESQNSISSQSLFYAGDRTPTQYLKEKGHVYGFTQLRFAEGWAKKNNYPYIYQFITTNYKLDEKPYSRNTVAGAEYNDNEFTAFNVISENLISNSSNPGMVWNAGFKR